MVVQADAPLPVTGSGTPGREVLVSIADQTKSGIVDPNDTWRVNFDPLTASPSPLTLQAEYTDTTDDARTVNDILAGDVWFCTGQSNMAFTLGQSLARLENYRQYVDAADIRGIRLYRRDWKGWRLCLPGTVTEFSSVGFFFAVTVNEVIDRPLGMIDMSVSGASTEAFISPETLDADPDLKEVTLMRINWYASQGKRQIEAHKEWRDRYGSVEPAVGGVPEKPRLIKRLHPAVFEFPSVYWRDVEMHASLPIKGCLWYQGEANGHTLEMAEQQRLLLPALIDDYRHLWNDPNLPFIAVQLPNIEGFPWWPHLRESQRSILKMDRTGLVPTIDLGDPADAHPADKRPVGERLARWALSRVYKKPVVENGPLVGNIEILGNGAIITFNVVGDRLKTSDGKTPREFAISFDDTNMEKASAEITSPDQIHITWPNAPGKRYPKIVYYAWHDNPSVNLINSEGLPAMPFEKVIQEHQT